MLYSLGDTHYVRVASRNGLLGPEINIPDPDGKYIKILVDFAKGIYSLLMAHTLGGNWTEVASGTESLLAVGQWYFTYQDKSGLFWNSFTFLNPEGCADLNITSYPANKDWAP